MIVPMMTGLRVEVRKERPLEKLAEAFNAQTLTRISIVTIKTSAQRFVLDAVHLIAFVLSYCCHTSKTDRGGKSCEPGCQAVLTC